MWKKRPGRTHSPLRGLCPATLFVLGLFSLHAQAASHEAATEQVQAQLIASVEAVRPGDEILIGVRQRIIPHWHTYWENPGDSGLATRIQYDLPPGTTAGEIQWPTPSRITLGPVVNYGYQNEVTLLSSLKIAKDAAINSKIPIKAKVNWLVCEEACIPQQVDLALELPVVDQAGAIGSKNHLIEQARAGLPIKSPWPARLEKNGDHLMLHVIAKELQSDRLQAIWFYPKQWGRISHGAEQTATFNDDKLTLQLKPGDDPIKPGERLSGVLAISEKSEEGPITRGYQIDEALEDAQSNPPSSALGLYPALFLALLGGLILNLMPCVFPVLSFKALALLSHREQSQKQIRLQGWAYTFGILASFALLGGLLILLKAGGAQIGWGFQFQSPLFVLFAAYLMFAVGLNLSGVFSINNSAAGVGAKLTERPGYWGSFFTGVLATLVATPCTAPFMGAAMGFAISQPPALLLMIFLSLGFGLASPYLILCYWPLLQHCLPKPGLWMERLKQGMAFPMYGAATWLVWVLAQQSGIQAVAVTGGGMVAIGFAAWLYEISRLSAKGMRRVCIAIAGSMLVLVLLAGYIALDIAKPAVSNGVPKAQNWEKYSAARLQELRADEKPVFVNFTAAWCISCLVNEQVALSQPSVKDTFNRLGITYLKGDWTKRDGEITEALAFFGRSGVPLYLYYPRGDQAEPLILPQILTPEIVINAVSTASH